LSRAKSILALGSTLATILTLAAVSGAHAAVAQTTFDRWKDNATEAVEVTVLSVEEFKQAASIDGMPFAPVRRSLSQPR
jgi:hypothetical protein